MEIGIRDTELKGKKGESEKGKLRKRNERAEWMNEEEKRTKMEKTRGGARGEERV